VDTIRANALVVVSRVRGFFTFKLRVGKSPELSILDDEAEGRWMDVVAGEELLDVVFRGVVADASDEQRVGTGECC